MKRTSSSRSGRNGYTLFELMIVIVILGIVLSLAAPNMAGMLSANRADGLMGRVASDIMTARMEAIRAGRRVDFMILSGGTRIAVVRSALPGGTADTLRKFSVTTEFPGVHVSPGTLTLRFDSRGLVSSGSGTTVTAYRGSEVRTLQVSSVGTVYRAN